jgi:prepilin-type N-terminal cleavage/methylation domain-containing protein
VTPKRRQQGFTLIELLVVVAILGSLAAAVSVYMRPQRSVMDSANLLADSVREAARKAFGSGPVPAAFAARGIDYRTRVVSDGTVVTLWELDVNQPTASDPFRAVKTISPRPPDGKPPPRSTTEPQPPPPPSPRGSPPSISSAGPTVIAMLPPCIFSGPTAPKPAPSSCRWAEP